MEGLEQLTVSTEAFESGMAFNELPKFGAMRSRDLRFLSAKAFTLSMRGLTSWSTPTGTVPAVAGQPEQGLGPLGPPDPSQLTLNRSMRIHPIDEPRASQYLRIRRLECTSMPVRIRELGF